MNNKYLRKSAIVVALHLNRDAQLPDIADFVSRAREDFNVNVRPSTVVLTGGGFKMVADVGDWLVVDHGILSVWGDEEFRTIHEYIQP